MMYVWLLLTIDDNGEGVIDDIPLRKLGGVA